MISALCDLVQFPCVPKVLHFFENVFVSVYKYKIYACYIVLKSAKYLLSNGVKLL